MERDTMSLPLVSIIIPSYNYAKYIPETLDCVISQTYQQWECIIIDDGSTDDTEIVVKPYLKDARFKYIKQKNGGLANARNTGLHNSKGTYIQFLDADDLMEEDKILYQVTQLEKDKTIDIIYSDTYNFKNGDNHKTNSIKFTLGGRPQQGNGLLVVLEHLKDNFFLVHSALIKRTVYEDIGMFDEDFKTCEDWNFWFRSTIRKKNIHYYPSDACKVYVRSHGENMSGNRLKMWEGRILFYTKAIQLYKTIAANYFTAEELKQLKQQTLFWLYIFKMRYNMYYKNIYKGTAYLLRTIFLLNGKYFYIIYDGTYWFKERLINKKIK